MTFEAAWRGYFVSAPEDKETPRGERRRRQKTDVDFDELRLRRSANKARFGWACGRRREEFADGRGSKNVEV